jgi:PAS domain-containing protein
VIGKHYTFCIRPDYIGRIVDFYKKQVSDQKVSSYLEFPVISKSQEQVWIGQNIQMRYEDRLFKEASAVARNITDKIQAEEKIQKSEEKYRSIIEHMKLGVLEIDKEERITFAYERFARCVAIVVES